jgi:hypothetical protein
MDDSTNGDKDDAWKFLRTLTAKHYTITNASENYRTATQMAKKHTGAKKIRLMGGMSKVGKYLKRSFISSFYHLLAK